MKALEKIRDWISQYPGHNILSQFQVDYTSALPENGGIFPGGLVENRRTEDILGNVETENQYNFALYYVFTKADGDDAGAAVNADWVMDFQEWVQQKSITGDIPQFGDKTISIKAQNGVMYSNSDEGTAMYAVALSVVFKKKYEVN